MGHRDDLFNRKRLKTLLEEFMDEVEDGVEKVREEAGPRARRLKEEGRTVLGEFLEELEKGARKARTHIQQTETSTSPEEKKTAEPDAQQSQKPTAVPDRWLAPAYGADLRRLISRDFELARQVLAQEECPAPGQLDKQLTLHLEEAPGPGWYLYVLGEVMCPTVVFLDLNQARESYSPATFQALEEILLAGWEAFQAHPVPGPLRQGLQQARAEEGGEAFIRSLEVARQSIFQSTLPEEAQAKWQKKRVQTPLMGAAQKLTHHQVALRELWLDVCLLQWGSRKDIQRARQKISGPEGGGDVCATIGEMDRSADMIYEDMLTTVLHPEKALKTLSPQDRRKLASYGRTRDLKPLLEKE